MKSEERDVDSFPATVNLLQRYTLPTQMATGGVMSGLGSCIAQHAIEGKEWNEHEAYRTRRLMAYGGIIFAPVANRWHAALNLVKLRGRWSSEFFPQRHLDAGQDAPRAAFGERLKEK